MANTLSVFVVIVTPFQKHFNQMDRHLTQNVAYIVISFHKESSQWWYHVFLWPFLSSFYIVRHFLSSCLRSWRIWKYIICHQVIFNLFWKWSTHFPRWEGMFILLRSCRCTFHCNIHVVCYLYEIFIRCIRFSNCLS